MKISILLPYKENFSPVYAGAVSLFLKDTIKLSRYKKNITVYGHTNFKKKLLNNYKNIDFSKFFLKSSTKTYLNKFLKHERLIKSDLIEIHNRPEYVDTIYKCNKNIVFYYHNNPLEMKSSYTLNDRLNILRKTKKIIFNSNWTLKQFIKNIKKKDLSNKLSVIHQSTNKKKINFDNKKNLIIFVGRLNTAKGYDIFGKAIINVLNKYPNWKSVVIGDEPRDKFNFSHKNLKLLGFLNHNSVIKWFTKSKISVACSRNDEPFGRTALEASSCGCAVIINNKGGLTEASPDAINLKKLDVNVLENEIIRLIDNDKQLLKLQRKIYNNFRLTNKNSSKKIDSYRDSLIRL